MLCPQTPHVLCLFLSLTHTHIHTHPHTHSLPLSLYIITIIGNSEFQRLTPIRVINNYANPSTDIHLYTSNDETALEYDDRVLLKFTPTHVNLTPGLERNFEYIRDTAVVNIIDNDRKCPSPQCLYNNINYYFSFADQFRRVRLFYFRGFR